MATNSLSVACPDFSLPMHQSMGATRRPADGDCLQGADMTRETNRRTRLLVIGTSALALSISPAWAQSSSKSSAPGADRSEEHTSALKSLMTNSYAILC